MENFGKSVNELVVDDAVEEIKAEMRSHGFEYDDINSDPEGGYIVFDTDGGTFPSGGFGSWDEVREWLDGMVFDESSTEIVQESQKGFVVADSNGNVISFKNGHRSFAPLGDNAVIYFNRDAAEKALYVFSDHCGIQGLSIKMIDGDGNILDCVDESDGDDSEKSELRKAFDYNKDKFMKKTGGKATLNKGVRKGLIQSVKHGVKVGRKFADKKVGAKVATAAATKAATKVAAKTVGKAVGKAILKKVPFVSLGAGATFAVDRALKGDFFGSTGEIASGVAGCLPVVGSAASLGIDAALAARDVKNAVTGEKKPLDSEKPPLDNEKKPLDGDKKMQENFAGEESEEYPLPCDGLAKRKTVRAAHNYIYDNILPVTKGLFSDVYWEPVQKVFEILSSEMGMNVNFGARNDNYYQHGYSADGKSKAWQFDAKYRNMFGKDVKINGQIIAHAAGTVEDPMSRYDLTFQLF